ncbi:golgin subfamily B member 1 [Arapaima gigas]
MRMTDLEKQNMGIPGGMRTGSRSAAKHTTERRNTLRRTAHTASRAVMFSRLAQGVNSVLQEFSGEENPDGGTQDDVDLQPPAPHGEVPGAPGGQDDTAESLAQMEQLVVQLKEMIREKDNQLNNMQRQLKEERDASEVRFTKLKLQAKAKMTALSKQISELKGQEGSTNIQSPDSSFTMAPGMEEELQQLKHRLQEEESMSRMLREQLETSEQQLREKDEKYAEQVRVLQAVVCEKDMRFQEQVQKHEEELMKATAQRQGDAELQQALRVAQRRSEELEEALRSRTEVLEMLQQEVSSADEQKQILTAQFRQMEQELAESRRQLEEEKQRWAEEASRTQAELTDLTQKLAFAQRGREEVAGKQSEALVKLEAELSVLKEQLEAAVNEKEAVQMRMETEKEERRVEISELRERLEAAESRERLEAAERDNVERTEAEQRETELKELRERLEAMEREKGEMKTEVQHREAEMVELRERLEVEKTMRAEAEQRGAEVQELSERLEAAEREKEELEKTVRAEAQQKGAELEELRERLGAAEAERVQVTQREAEAISRLEGELAALRDGVLVGRDVEGAGQQETTVLAELWKGLCILARGDEAEEDRDKEEPPVPADLAQCETVLRALEARLLKLGTEKQESEERCAQIAVTMETLQGELAKSIADRQESQSQIQQLEQEILTLQAVESSVQVPVFSPGPEGKVSDKGGEQAFESNDSGEQKPESMQLMTLEQLLSEKEEELAALRARLALAEEQRSMFDSGTVLLGNTEHNHDRLQVTQDKTEELIEFPTDIADEERTLIAEEPALSASVDTESSPELISLHPESPEEREMKGTSSDEMVTSTDSEVAQGSWTLLEAGNQDGNQEWPSFLPDFGQLPHQTSDMTVQNVSSTSSVQVESSSVVFHESVHVQITQQEQLTSGQAFAQALAEELQGRYSELLAEFEKLKEQLSDSQLRIRSLEEEQQLLTIAKEEAKQKALELEEALEMAKAEVQDVAQQKSSELESQSVQCSLLQEQLSSLQIEARSKDQKIQALQADMDETHHRLAEQEGQARMLSAQLEEKELVASELEQRLMDTESKLQDVEELQLRIAQKEQEMMELSDAMSTKLLQAGEEKFLINSEVTKLKQQVTELENVLEQEKMRRDTAPNESEELTSLRKDKEDLTTQVATIKKEGEQMKRKLQAALVQRKELIKKVGEFEKQVERMKEQDGAGVEKMCSDTSSKNGEEGREEKQEVKGLESPLEETDKMLRERVEAFETLEEKMVQKDQSFSKTLAVNERRLEEADGTKSQDEELAVKEKFEQEKALLQSQLASLESEHDALQKKLQEAMESRKDTIRKAKEKDRHHREQLKQQKEEYNALLQRFEEMVTERDKLLNRLEELKSLREEMQSEQAARLDLEKRLQDSQEFLSLRESELQQLGEELKLLREKEKQIDTLSLELEDLREKYQQAEKQAEMLKAEVEATTALGTKGVVEGMDSPISQLQGEVEEFKQFLNCKNSEILELSQQLSEQNSLLQMMQETVSEKDQLIASLQDSLRTEQEKNQKLEAEIPLRHVTETTSDTKLQQLQRKLQAALISRKDALKESKMHKEALESLERDKAELRLKLEAGEAELIKLRGEKDKLIEEVDRALLENQSLGASCESLKLAMEGVVKEKEGFEQEVAAAKEQAAQVNREWEEKVQAMKEEYETLLSSYENVSDEAERVRRVLETARQERQELAAKAKAHEAARQEAERLVEEAQKEVETVKEKMRKFAKAKQQKIMDLEEENERLREMEEKKGDTVGRDNIKHKEELDRIGEELDRTREELDRTREEKEALRANLDASMAQMDSLKQGAEELRDQLTRERERTSAQVSAHGPVSVALVEESITVQQSSTITTQTPKKVMDSHLQDSDKTEQPRASEVDSCSPDSAEKTLKGKTHVCIPDGAEKFRQMEEALEAEKESLRVREAELAAQLVSLEQQLQDSRLREENLRDEIVKWEAKHQEVQARLEAERDDIEERLMNQLAQVNGSIAGYQQEAADRREHLLELQRAVEKLERERAEFEAQANSEKDRACRLEEDKRQAQRERAEAEAEVQKQRELEQKLKSAQRCKEGSQSRARQLEELLREKQLEVRQMQKDCIRYQEKISEQEKETKALQLGRDEAQRELTAARLEMTKVGGEMKKAEADLSTCKARLDDTLSEVARLQAEKQAAEENFLRRETESKAEAERALDSVRLRLGAELKQAEIRLEDVLKEKEREERATREARKLVEAREMLAQEMQVKLDESLARLAAFSRSMSSLQDDRDRVLDEARQWESRFHSALQGKEAELREAETRARDLADQLQKETAQREELHLAVERLQDAAKNWEVKCQEQEKMHKESQALLEKEREELKEALVKAESLLDQKSILLTSLEAEAEGLRHRTQALEEAVGELQKEVEEARATLREREAEERRLVLNLEQLETDLRSSKTLTETLQSQLGEKERREVELLGEKEQAVAQAADEARREAEGRAQEAEKEVEHRRQEVRALEEKVQKAEEESSQSKARLDAFTKAMGSLQDDRDRVLTQYKQLEERHLQVMMEKDALIQEAAGENNSLKEELRNLLAQRDDLNAENAKLSAQLHGYRDDLTQVLSMKDSQHKQLLAAQLEHIQTLERERTQALARVQELETELENLQGQLQTLERQKEETVIGVMGTNVEHRVEREALSQASSGETRKTGGPPEEKEEEEVVQKLREQLAASQEQVTALEEKLRAGQDGDKTLGEELKELRWEHGVFRTQAETAEERVAELARDLVELEQKLLQEREATAQLQAQNQSFGQAMASLQDSHDQAMNEAQELRLRLEEMSRTSPQSQVPSPPAGNSGEVWALKNALSALQNDRERLLEQLQLHRAEVSRLTTLTEELQEEKTMTEKEGVQEERREEQERLTRELQDKDEQLEKERQEMEMLRRERKDWQAQVEVFKQQTLATLSERDEQVRQLNAMLEEARAPRAKLVEEQYQREASAGTALSSEPQVMRADSGHLRSQLDDSLRQLHLKELKITELSNKLSQVFEEKRLLSAQLRGNTQRLGDSQSRCSALERQLQELQEDKRKGVTEVDSAPGGPQERSDPSGANGYREDMKELQRRLDEELEQKQVLEEQLLAASERLKSRYTMADLQTGDYKGNFSETAVLIDPPEGAVMRTRSSGPGLGRMLRVMLCSRQRTPLLAFVYLLTVHVLLLLCLGGYL